MTSQDVFDQFVESQKGVRSLLLRDLAAWFETVSHLPPSEIRREARSFMTVLVTTYGEVSAAAASDFYDMARSESVAAKAFRASMPRSQAAAQMLGNLKWSTEPLFAGDPAAALGRLGVSADAAALQDGRNAVMYNARRDPSKPRWARIPVGKTCAWCLMLASRGAVYRSAESAGGAGQFHGGDCNCQPVPSWDGGKDMPPSYDEGGLLGTYDRARSDAGSANPNEIAKAIRRLDGGALVSDGVAAVPR